MTPAGQESWHRYNQMRRGQLEELKRFRPYWMYVNGDSEGCRQLHHERWDGLVIRADDAWWDQNFPPNGRGCQCTVHGLNDRDLARLGKKVVCGEEVTPYVTSALRCMQCRGGMNSTRK